MISNGHSIAPLSEALVLFQVTKKTWECRLNQVVNCILG